MSFVLAAIVGVSDLAGGSATFYVIALAAIVGVAVRVPVLKLAGPEYISFTYS